MLSLKYKIILKTSHKQIHRVEYCMKTWLKNLDYVCLTDKLTGQFNEISGSERDDYRSAEEKTVFLINKVKNTVEFDQYDWLVFIDNDAILNVKMFEYIIEYLDKNKVYGIRISGSPQDNKLVFPSGGGGYFISPSLIKKSNSMVNQGWGLEDVSIGKWLYDNNIDLLDHYFIGDTKYHMNQNGWWPFQNEKKLLNSEDQNAGNMRTMVIQKAVTEETKTKLRPYLTHHYMLDYVEMEYVHSIFKDWNPQYLLVWQ